jgi:hypothetical protein
LLPASAFAQRPPERFGVGQQQLLAIPAKGNVVLLLAGNQTAADRGQLGGSAAAVARLDGGVRDVSSPA